jgi:uncharacterized protein
MRAEKLPGGLGTFRLITFAQSFHWVDQPRVARTAREMLEPGGAFALVHATTHQGVAGDDPLPSPRPPRSLITELVASYLGPVRRAGRSLIPAGPPSGEDAVLRGAGFRGPDRIEVGGGAITSRTEDEVVASVFSLADTHAPRRWKSCPPLVAGQLRRADVILHAGDVCTAAVLEELSDYAPVLAVLGNNDGPDVARWGAPETLQTDLDGLRVAMLHDSGPAPGRLRRLRRRFPGAGLVVFGHSHIPLDEAGEGIRVVNPGSPTDRRRQPHGTVAVLRIESGQLVEAAIVPVS